MEVAGAIHSLSISLDAKNPGRQPNLSQHSTYQLIMVRRHRTTPRDHRKGGMRDALQAGDSKATPRLYKHVIDLAPITQPVDGLCWKPCLASFTSWPSTETYHTHLLAAAFKEHPTHSGVTMNEVNIHYMFINPSVQSIWLCDDSPIGHPSTGQLMHERRQMFEAPRMHQHY